MEQPDKKILNNIIHIRSAICISALTTHSPVYDFDFRNYFDATPVFNAVTQPLILRIGAISDYARLFHSLQESGLNLINNIEQHNIASLLPHWYPLIAPYTPRSKWYDQLPDVTTIMEDFTFPVFIKGERQTNRHQLSSSKAANKKELQNILDNWKNDPILNWQKLICREFIPLEKIGDALGDKLQYSKEFRVFTWKNKVIEMGQYWADAPTALLTSAEQQEITILVEEVAQIVNVPFLVIDVAKVITGEWIVIELNDAQESGYAGVAPLKLWSKIIAGEEARLQSP